MWRAHSPETCWKSEFYRFDLRFRTHTIASGPASVFCPMIFPTRESKSFRSTKNAESHNLAAESKSPWHHFSEALVWHRRTYRAESAVRRHGSMAEISTIKS